MNNQASITGYFRAAIVAIGLVPAVMVASDILSALWLREAPSLSVASAAQKGRYPIGARFDYRQVVGNGRLSKSHDGLCRDGTYKTTVDGQTSNGTYKWLDDQTIELNAPCA